MLQKHKRENTSWSPFSYEFLRVSLFLCLSLYLYLSFSDIIAMSFCNSISVSFCYSFHLSLSLCTKEIEGRCKTHIIWEAPFKFSHWLTPISCCLLTDELNIEEWPLTWAKHVTWSGATHNTGRYICYQVLQKHIYRQICELIILLI